MHTCSILHHLFQFKAKLDKIAVCFIERHLFCVFSIKKHKVNWRRLWKANKVQAGNVFEKGFVQWRLQQYQAVPETYTFYECFCFMLSVCFFRTLCSSDVTDSFIRSVLKVMDEREEKKKNGEMNVVNNKISVWF